ncbi:AAA family ATPase [Fusibacter bizertensis]
MQRTIYIISGPAGVGKSTTSKRLVERLDRSSYISGDDVSHIPVNGRGKPWLCKETHDLTWKNILSLIKNLISYNYDIVIDYVTFPSEARWLVKELKYSDVRIHYIILMVDKETIIHRDSLRAPSVQMGERSVVLLNEFNDELNDFNNVLDTQEFTADQVDLVVNEILNSNRFLIN